MATAEQKSRAEIYRDAAREHVTLASELYDLNKFLMANYVAGLGVECILRAYRLMIDPEFDSRHNIDKLYKLARFADVVPKGKEEEMGAAFGDVIILWSNDHRFLSEAGLRKRWAKRKLYEGVKGDFVKERVRQLVNKATLIVSIGVAKWTNSFKN